MWDCFFEVIDIVCFWELFGKIEMGEVEFIVCDMIEFLLFLYELFNVNFYVFFDDVLLEECCSCVVVMCRLLFVD